MRLFQSLPWVPHSDRRVYCYTCNHLHPLAATVADLDGPAYRAYYCQPCAEKLIADGLLFWIVESSATDPDNTGRGFRAVAFDIFGEVVYRPNLADMVKTSDKARALYREWREGFDIAAHYREALESRARRLDKEAQGYRDAIAQMEPLTA